MKCVLCDRLVLEVNSHNAWPLADGRCCGICNDTKVIPARIAVYTSKENRDEQKDTDEP